MSAATPQSFEVLLEVCVFLRCCRLVVWEPSSAHNDVWRPIGPDGGSVPVLAVDPQTPTTVYAATSGGVFKSYDGWRALGSVNNGLLSKPLMDRLWPGRRSTDSPTLLFRYERGFYAGAVYSRAPMAAGAGSRRTPSTSASTLWRSIP